MTFILGVVLMYIFSVIAFNFLRVVYVVDDDIRGDTLLSTFVETVCGRVCGCDGLVCVVAQAGVGVRLPARR